MVFVYLSIFLDLFYIRSGRQRRILAAAAPSAVDCSELQTTETHEPLFASLIRIDHPSFLVAAVAITIFIVTAVV
jgi:hypothetical protein